MLGLINKRQITKLKTVAKGGIILAAVLCFLGCLFSFNFVHAQPLDTGLAYAEQTGLPTTDLRVIIANIIRVALGLLGTIAVVIVLYGGWLWMSAGGNEEQIEKAKKTLLNGVVGLIIILSAYGIVLFVMKMFGIGEGGGAGGFGTGGGGQPGMVNIVGSGALGSIVKDHYPMRDQKDVPRNTKIAITFYIPISTSSVANPDGTLKDSIKIAALISSSTAPNGVEERAYTDGAKVTFFETVSKEDENKKEVYTLVISPDVMLGSGENKMNYSVIITNGVLKENSKSIFEGRRTNFYRWYFQCDILDDKKPPYVVSVYPSSGQKVSKNSVIQINFSEPMFPNGQVGFEPESDYFVDNVNVNPIVYLKTGKNTVPQGFFQVSNQYKTLEFISTDMCDVNACGKPIFCLPVCETCEDTYQLLLRAASTTTDPNKPPFYSDLMDGFVDMAGNALDDGDEIVERNVIVSPFSESSKNPDNYYWSFLVNGVIDKTTPVIENLTIGPGAQKVSANEEFKISWSKIMRFSSLYKDGISLREAKVGNDTISFVPSSVNGSGKTITQIIHGPFLEGTDQTYIPEVTSNVEDINYNCFYPGAGPGASCGTEVLPYCCNGAGHVNPENGTYSDTCYNSLLPN